MMTKKLPMFFKFMLPNFSEKLSLPPAFLKHLKMEKCHTVILKSALGISWEVEVWGSDENLWFGNGWPDFARVHNLQLGDCLVFCFDGDMTFHVTVFDRSCCKKKLLLGKKDEERKRVEEPIPLATKKAKKQGCRSCNAVRDEIRPSYECDKPHFIVCMLPSHVRNKSYVHIPTRFRKVENMSQMKNLILIDPCGRSWPVKVFHRERGDISLTCGWFSFRKNNALEVGDFCIFEFTDETKKTMNVQIIRR